MSDKHTQGRLVVRPHGGNWSASYEGYGSTAYMGIVSDTGEVIALATAYSPNPFCEPAGPDENARRLVACWNACEMASTEDLEALTRPADVSWACTIDRLARERDELLAVLKQCREMVGHPDNVAVIDAAIAKAEAK